MVDKMRRPYLAMDLDEFRKPGTIQSGMENSVVRMPSRYLIQALSHESEFEKPYEDGGPRKMHLDPYVPDWPTWDPPTGPPRKPGEPVGPGCPACALAFDAIYNCEEDWGEAHALIYCSYMPGTDCPDCQMQITAVVGQIQEIQAGTWSRRASTEVVVSSADVVYDPKTGQTKIKQPPISGTMSLKVKVNPAIENHVLKAEMIDGGGNYCEAYLEVTCGCECPAKNTFQIDSGSTDTITSSKTGTVVVQGGCGPFTWSISGTGWSISPNGLSDLMAATASVTTSTCNKLTSAPKATVSITDKCGTTVTHEIHHEGATWESIAGFGRGAACDAGDCCGAAGLSCAANGTNVLVYHYKVGTGAAYDAKWEMRAVLTGCGTGAGGCAGDCRDACTGNHTQGGGSDCGADTIMASEYGCTSKACCECSGSLYYWTCGDDCS